MNKHTPEPCHDCKINMSTVTYGLGAKRCPSCSEAFDAVIREKRQEEFRKEQERIANHKCGEIEDDLCEECCDHDDVCTDERCCLVCGKDMTEEWASAAYDRWKDEARGL